MLPHNPRPRQSLTIAGLLTLALILVVVLAHVNAANGSEPNRVEEYECNRAHYVEYEDHSGRLFCGRHVIVKVSVPR